MGASPKAGTHLNPRKRPCQARSRQMQADILVAAADILRMRGLSDFTTNAIAERAGVSIGSLYQYYPAKEAILAALIRDMRKEMRADLAGAVTDSTGNPLAETICALIEASLRHHLRDPALSVMLERVEDALPMDAETDALKADMATLVTDVLRAHRIGDPARTAADLIAMCHGMVHAALRAGETDFDDLSRRMNRAAMGYICAHKGATYPERS